MWYSYSILALFPRAGLWTSDCVALESARVRIPWSAVCVAWTARFCSSKACTCAQRARHRVAARSGAGTTQDEDERPGKNSALHQTSTHRNIPYAGPPRKQIAQRNAPNVSRLARNAVQKNLEDIPWLPIRDFQSDIHAPPHAGSISTIPLLCAPSAGHLFINLLDLFQELPITFELALVVVPPPKVPRAATPCLLGDWGFASTVPLSPAMDL